MYTVKFTDKSKTPINIDEEQIDNSTAITLFGRKRLSYGKGLQDNLLNILENFSCPEDADIVGTPDKIKAKSGIFDNPIEGQCWYNSTTHNLSYYDGTNWIPFAREDDIAANWGVIVDGQFLPKPVSEITGKVFDYPECAWIVSPFSFPQKLDYMECKADENALVTMKYRLSGTDDLLGGTANYLIIGIAGNENAPQPTFMITPTPTPTPTSTFGASPTPTPTVTATVTPTISLTPSVTPEPTISPTPSVTPSVTYQIPVSRTPTPTPSRTPVASVTPTPSPVAPLVFASPGSDISVTCSNIPNGSCSPYRAGTLSASGGHPPYTYTAIHISGDGMSTFGSFNTPVAGNLPVHWQGPIETVGRVDAPARYTTVFQYKVTDSKGKVAYTSNVTVKYYYINTA